MTLTDLYRKTLEKLQVAAAGESAAPEDTALIASKYVTAHALLQPRGLVSWTAAEAVPDEAVEPLVAILAYASATEFGAQIDPEIGAIGLPQPSLAERQLRALHSRAYVSYPAQSEYF